MNQAYRDAMGRAFAVQAASDMRAYERMCRQPGLPMCHRLHFLQMALEKLAKSWLWRESRPDEDELHFSHNVIAKVLPRILQRHWKGLGISAALSRAKLERIRRLCREIDLLHPQVDAGQTRPDNCEYPWTALENGGRVVKVPARERFALDGQLRTPEGKEFLKAVFALCQQAVTPGDVAS